MGGTALSVLSPYSVERVDALVAEEMVAGGLVHYEPDPSYWYSADGLPFGYDVGSPDSESDPGELRLVERAAGMTMRCEIMLYIFVSSLAGRPALALIAERVARRTEGWVFVEFTAPPPAADLIRHLTGAGHCIQVDDVAVYLDAAAMTAWTSHPAFHVVR